tara:strand:- start:42 stop:833 length:792 start_codon:yes stop_codon:yes gene_type:complete
MGRRTVALITAVWKRHELTDLVLNRFRSIKDELADTIDLELIAVGSEGDTSRQLCENHGFTYVEHDNMPLNRKYNAASRLTEATDPDAVYRIDSDDWITSDAITNSLKMIDEGHLAVGLLDLYFMDLISFRLGRWPGYSFLNHKKRMWAWRNKGKTVGVGRCFSRELMDELGWEIWDQEPELSKWLDTNCDERLKDRGHKIKGFTMQQLQTFAMDIKGGGENITTQTFSNLRIKWVENAKSELYQHFPKEEVDSLIELGNSIN